MKWSCVYFWTPATSHSLSQGKKKTLHTFLGEPQTLKAPKADDSFGPKEAELTRYKIIKAVLYPQQTEKSKLKVKG